MTPRHRFCRTLLLLLALPACVPRAPTAILTGTVQRLPRNRPVTGVLVTAHSLSLPDERIVMTDGAGQYRIPQLPPGTYALRFEPEVGRETWRRDVRVEEGRTVRLDVALEPVTPASPPAGALDSGVYVGADFVRNIAVVRPCGRGRECHDLLRLRLDGCLPPTPPGQGARRPSWSHPYAPLVRPTGEPQLVHCSGG